MFVLVPRFDRLRSVVESEIQRLYRRRYGAVLETFAPVLVAELTQAGTVECAAGFRFGHEPLFLECYLDGPIEEILEHHLCSQFERSRIVEVCHLAGAGTGCSLRLYENYCDAGGYRSRGGDLYRDEAVTPSPREKRPIPC